MVQDVDIDRRILQFKEDEKLLTVCILEDKEEKRLLFYYKDKKEQIEKRLENIEIERNYGKKIADYSADTIENCTTGIWLSVVGEGYYLTKENLDKIKEEIR